MPKFSSETIVILCVLCSCLLAAPGCGPANPLEREAISGQVMFNGQPLQRGSIGFEPSQQGGVTSGAPVIDGRYEIAEHQGLPPGRYRVRINASKSDAAAISQLPPGTPEPPGIELIPPEYNIDSQQFIEVAGGRNQFDFHIDLSIAE